MKFYENAFITIVNHDRLWTYSGSKEGEIILRITILIY